ncbi:MAG: 4-phosphoerythronate dehydrogenase [Porphyromonas sp.]|nr:4-phosphoerythronate dehydrogenase [Porphyromonas sp.]
MKLKIVAEASIPYLRGTAEVLGEVCYLPNEDFSPKTISEADVLIVRSITKCTKELLSGSRVRLICTATAGFDHIDTDYCQRQGIAWRTAAGCNASAVAQYVFSCLSSLVRQGTVDDLRGKTIGIIGVGQVGTHVKQIALALGMQALCYDPPRGTREGNENFATMGEILHQSDIITLHTPLSRGGKHPTYHLVDRVFLHALKRKPVLINAARGAVCDTKALIDAYKSNSLSALVCDCWEKEPAIDRELIRICNIATPHIAGFSADGKSNGSRMSLESIADYFGLPFNAGGRIHPPAPQMPTIDLEQLRNQYPNINPIYTALLHTLDLSDTDRALRSDPGRFEEIRKSYRHPREPLAFSVLGGNSNERETLRKIGFQLG